jgi:hypothetical protein
MQTAILTLVAIRMLIEVYVMEKFMRTQSASPVSTAGAPWKSVIKRDVMPFR